MGFKLELVLIVDRKTSVEEIKTYLTGYVNWNVVGSDRLRSTVPGKRKMTVTAFKNCRFSINWGSLVQPRNYQMLKDQYRAYRNKFMQQILLKKQIVPQLINKFSAFYGARSFITEFTTARHWNLPLAKLKESTSSHPNSLRSHPTSLRSHLCLGLPSGLFPSYFLAKSLHKFP